MSVSSSLTRDPRASLIARYYLYTATSTIGFFLPVWIVLLDQYRSFTFTQIMVLDAVFFAVVLLAEVPTGYLGDRIGRRNALVLGTLGASFSVVAFGLVPSFEGLIVVYAVWGIALTLRSGNDSAWLYDVLVDAGEPGLFARVRGRGMAIFLVTNGATAIAGGYLYALDPAYPFVATGVTGLLAAGVLLTIPESTVVDDGEPFSVGEARTALASLGRPTLRWFVVYTALFFAIGWSVDLFVQPIVIRAGGSPIGLGYLYAGLMVAAAVGASQAGAVADRIGHRRLLLVAPLALGAAAVSVGLAPLAAVPAFLTMRFLVNLATPLAETYLNDWTPSLGRATVLSGWSMTISLATIPVKLASGPLADVLGPFTAVALLGGLLAVCSGVVIAIRGDRIAADADDGVSAGDALMGE